MSFSFRTLAATTALVFAGGVALAQENPTVGGAAMSADKNIIENAMNSADHTTLVAAVQAAGLAETLQGVGPFTVFAPTNAAFAALPAGTVETLLLPESKDQLARILSCHVVPTSFLTDELRMIEEAAGPTVLETLGGCTLSLTKGADGFVTVSDAAGNAHRITIADVRQSNGVIQVVDSVLLPAN